jgi:hypothetical protein
MILQKICYSRNEICDSDNIADVITTELSMEKDKGCSSLMVLHFIVPFKGKIPT